MSPFSTYCVGTPKKPPVNYDTTADTSAEYRTKKHLGSFSYSAIRFGKNKTVRIIFKSNRTRKFFA